MKADAKPRVIITAQADAPVREEVRAAAPDASVVRLGEGVWRVDASADPRVAWRAREPIFIRHVCPIDAIVAPTLDAITTRARALPLDPARSFSVQSRILTNAPFKPFDINQAVSADRANLDVRHPDQVISIVVADEAYLGLSDARANLSDWAGGNHRLKNDGMISRAEQKLIEALAVFRLALPTHGVAVDLGAAPGGWSRILRNHGLQVHAVDPARLDPRVIAIGVEHHAVTAERWLASDPPQLDVAVADMKMDARDAARLMNEVARHMRASGFAILTLKLPTHHQARVVDEALAILGERWRVHGARQLFHNRSEVTVALLPSRD